MFDCMRAQSNGGMFGFLYIFVFFLISNYIILNLFIGAILANMGTDTDEAYAPAPYSEGGPAPLP